MDYQMRLTMRRRAGGWDGPKTQQNRKMNKKNITNEKPTNSEDVPPLRRTPLARGRVYQFHGYPTKIRINHVAFRGHPEDDGGLEGVSVSWIKSNRSKMFYPCKSDEDFWAKLIFRNAFDCPNTQEQDSTK